jgi:sulfoquinovosidase
MRRLARIVAAAVLPACGGGGATIEVSDGTVTAVLHESPAQIELTVGGTVVWTTTEGERTDAAAPPLGFAGAGSGNPAVAMMYGSFKFDDRPGAWAGVDELGALAAGADGRSATFDLTSGGDVVATGRLAIEADGHVAITFTAIDVPAVQPRLSLASTCRPEEHLVGLGGQSFDVDHRGETVPLWVQEDGIGKNDLPDDDYNGVWFLNGRRHSTHTPMPMVLSSAGYAVVVDTDARATFALCSEDEGVARFETWDRELAVHVFLGDAGATTDALGRMLAWVGKPAQPPAFTFAPWVDALYGDTNVRRIAQRLRDEGVAASVIWAEDWRGGENTATGYALDEDWRVDDVLYPGFAATADAVHDLGFKLFTYYNTFLDNTADVYTEALALDHEVKTATGEPYLFDGVQFHPSALLDLTKPAAVEWAKAIMQEGIDLGADGWMADFAEWLPADATVASGRSALAEEHNRYPVQWAQLNAELFADQDDGVERLSFVRAAWLGSQPHVQVLWTGDQQTDFTDGDGLPSVIPMMINLGLAGFPYTGSDIGGYMSQLTVPTTEELWYRWVTLGAFSPVMRTHHGRDAALNYQWEADAGSVAHFRRWTRLHVQLVPYLRGLAAIAEASGLPLVRMTALHYPDEDWAWTAIDQYLLGDRMLVAPVVREGMTAREVRLPPGTWYPLAGGAGVSGGGGATVGAGVTEIPVLVPAGALIVVYPDGVDTVVDAPGDPGAVTAAEVAADRDVWLYRGTPVNGVGAWTDRIAPSADRTWSWSGRDEGAGLPTAATWNGAPVAVLTGATESVVELDGDGTLAFPGGGELVIAGGPSDARTTVRLR